MLERSSRLKLYLLSEIETAAALMDAEVEADLKLYYFSAAFGAAQRVLNIEPSPRLSLLHFVLLAAHGSINSRIVSARSGDSPNTVPWELLTDLGSATKELASKIDRGEDFIGALERITEIAYAFGGNGFYLYRTRRLSVQPL